jgi:AcrR family transcriptional regulator
MGNLRARLKEAATEQILESAEAVMIRKGFAGATMQEIAAAAGCAAGTLYLHFASKEAILQAINARRAETLFGLGHDAMAAVDDPLEKIRRSIAAQFRYLSENKAFFRLFFSVNPFRPRGMRKHVGSQAWALRSDYEAVELEHLKAAQAKGQIRGDIAADVLQDCLHAISINFADEYVQVESTMSEEELLRVVWGMFLSGVQAGGTDASK